MTITGYIERPVWQRSAWSGAAIVALMSHLAIAQPAPEPPEGERISLASAIDQDLEKAKVLVRELEDARERSSEWVEKFTEISKLTNMILERDSLNVKARYLQGRLAMLSGRPRDALPLIEAYTSSPVGAADWYAHKQLGDLYVVSYPEHARAEYREAARLAPNEAEPFYGLASAEVKLERADDATKNAQTAIRNDKKETASYREVLADALLLYKDKQAEAANAAREAVAITERRIQENPGDIRLLTDLKRQYELLVKCYTRQFEFTKGDPDVLIKLVRTTQDQADLERLINYHGALLTLENARTIPTLKDSIAVIIEQARLNRLLGRNQEAVELLTGVLEREPDNQEARDLLDIIAPDAPSAEGKLSAGTAGPPAD